MRNVEETEKGSKMTVKHCSYGICKSDSRRPEEGVEFVQFPNPQKYPKIAKRWAFLCGRKDDLDLTKIKRYTFICSKHFVGSMDYKNDPSVEPISARLVTETVSKKHETGNLRKM